MAAVTEFWMAALPTTRGEACKLPVSDLGTIIFFPDDPAQLLLLELADQEHPIRLRGNLKRVILTLVNAALCNGHSHGPKKS